MNLLTLDEKIFLSYLNFDFIEKNVNGYLIITYHDDFWDEYSIYRYCIYHPALKLKFSGLEFDKQYTRKELGL